MTTLPQETRSLHEPPAPGPALWFRLHGCGLDGRIVRLNSRRCSVGSGVNCTLRLVGPGIRPLHCLIVRGTQGTFVRRWSAGTYLNDRSFEDASLKPEDRLSVGPIDLEVVRDDRIEGDAASVSRHVQTDPDLERQLAGLRGRARTMVKALRHSRTRQETLESQVRESLEVQQLAEGRLRELTRNAERADERARHLQHEVARLEQEKAQLLQRNHEEPDVREVRPELAPGDEAQAPSSAEGEPKTEELQQRAAQLSQELEAANQALREQRELVGRTRGDYEESRRQLEALEGQNQALQAELDAHKDQHRSLVTQLEEARQELTSLRQEMAGANAAELERTSELEAAREDLRRKQAEIDEIRQSLEEVREELAAERETSQGQHATPSPAAEDRTSAPEAAGDADAAIARLRELSLWSEGEPSAEPSAEEEGRTAPAEESELGDAAPSSFIEKYMSQLEEGGEDNPPSGADQPAVDAAPSTPADERRAPSLSSREWEEGSRSDSAPSTPADDEDESLEAYMAQLMQRVRGEDRPRAPQGTQAAAPPNRTPAEPKPSNEPPKKAEKHEAKFRLEDMKRAAAPPERGGHFAAMRELANASAHSALSDYELRRTRRDVISKLLSAALCLASGIATLYLAPEVRSAAMLGGLAALGAAAYFALRGSLALLTLVRNGRKGSNPAESTNTAPLPHEDSAAQANSTK